MTLLSWWATVTSGCGGQSRCLTHSCHERNGLLAQQGFTEVDRGPIYGLARSTDPPDIVARLLQLETLTENNARGWE